MNLKSKKQLAARTLGVGVDRIILREGRIDEIKEAITRQDIRDLVANNAILIKPEKGSRKLKEGARRRPPGKIKKKINKRKHEYMRLTRKLREYSKQLMLQGRVSREKHKEIRKQIKSKTFRSKSHFKELLGGKK